MARNIYERLYEEFMERSLEKISTMWSVRWSVRVAETAQQVWMSEAESHLKRTTQQPTLKSYLPNLSIEIGFTYYTFLNY